MSGAYTDLRHLAEQMIVDEDVAAILALLDERDQLDRSLDDRALLEGRAEAAERRVASLTDALASAEERVSGLEEGLRAYMEHHEPESYWDNPECASVHEKARALLAAAPSEPPYDQYGWREVTQGVAPGWNIPHGECPSCDDASAAHLAGMHDPAALTSASADAEVSGSLDVLRLDMALQTTHWWERGRAGANGLSSYQLAEEVIAALAAAAQDADE